MTIFLVTLNDPTLLGRRWFIPRPAEDEEALDLASHCFADIERPSHSRKQQRNLGDDDGHPTEHHIIFRA